MNRKELTYSVYLLQEDTSRLKDGIVGRCKIGHTCDLDPSFNERRLQIVRSCSPLNGYVYAIESMSLPEK